jgi:4-amino-4-deoxy-L-arabinose transferase-like glycosyltransferase
MTTVQPRDSDQSRDELVRPADDVVLTGRRKGARPDGPVDPVVAHRLSQTPPQAPDEATQLGGVALLKELGQEIEPELEPEKEPELDPVPASKDEPAAEAAVRGWRRRPLGLIGVLVLQALISLSFIWSNTAFADEANYLWVGHLELAHWFGGAPTPHFDVLSGAPLIYPPLGALASAIGGLAGARILSLALMLGATALLYSVSSRLFGQRAAVAAAALWAVSVSSLKLGAFATFDPLAVFFMCLSAWLVVQAAFRRRSAELAILAALAMLLGDLTAYSYAIYDVAIIAFALAVWWLRLGTRRTVSLSLWFLGAALMLGFIIPTIMGLWAGIVAVTITRKGGTTNENQGYLLVAQLSWEWSGLVAVLGLAGTFTAFAGRASKRVLALLAVLAGSAFLVPLYQLHLQTGWSLDKHLACGIWLAAMPAGYLVARVARIPVPVKSLLALAGAAALAFPAVAGWMSAYSDYHTWPNATRLLATVKPLAEAPHTGGLFTTANDIWVLDYYTGSHIHGPQWATGRQINLNPAQLPESSWPGYFQSQLNADKYSVVALPFAVATSQFSVPAGRSGRPGKTQLLADLTSLTAAEPYNVGIDDFAAAVESNANYQLVGVVPYSDDLAPGSYLVWKRIGS